MSRIFGTFLYRISSVDSYSNSEESISISKKFISCHIFCSQVKSKQKLKINSHNCIIKAIISSNINQPVFKLSQIYNPRFGRYALMLFSLAAVCCKTLSLWYKYKVTVLKFTLSSMLRF